MEKRSFPNGNRGTETILVVEDEPGVRRLVSQMLMLSGYTVVDAANGPEAIDLINGYNRPIDLLLTDIVMPFMSGGELAERLSQRRHDMRVLFTSGYMDDAVVKEVVAMGGQFLPKPFTPEVLVQKVREVLDEPWWGLAFRSDRLVRRAG